jgi:uncharacterized protein (TIGR02265 family)
MRPAVEQEWEEPAPGVIRVPRRSLEALVEPQRPLTPALGDALRLAGYDPDAEAAAHYPLSVFRAVMRVVGAHLLPEGTDAERLRRAGHVYIEGFGRNPVGRVFQAGLRILGPDRALGRLPAAVRFGLEGVRLDMEVLGIRRWRARMLKAPQNDPEFVCGCLEGMLQLTGAVHPRVETESSLPLESTVLITWEA